MPVGGRAWSCMCFNSSSIVTVVDQNRKTSSSSHKSSATSSTNCKASLSSQNTQTPAQYSPDRQPSCIAVCACRARTRSIILVNNMQQRAAFVGSNFFRPQFIAIFRTSDLACNISRGLFASVKRPPISPGNTVPGITKMGTV